MSDTYVIQVSGFTAGIVTHETEGRGFHFFSAAPRFSAMEGQHFSVGGRTRGAKTCRLWQPPAAVRHLMSPQGEASGPPELIGPNPLRFLWHQLISKAFLVRPNSV